MDDPLRVISCELCRIFSNLEVKTKLYWPEKIEDIPTAEFIIVESISEKLPLLVYKEHVLTIPKDSWGRILYRCRLLFGSNVRLRYSSKRILDHYHCYIIEGVK